ncbi:hypothetical protein CMI37_20175 [Candidatus Pacearchaeota archaeon]|nr:hypothetical protein [Candidatus Pacearchaeota archaeon]
MATAAPVAVLAGGAGVRGGRALVNSLGLSDDVLKHLTTQAGDSLPAAAAGLAAAGVTGKQLYKLLNKLDRRWGI